MEMGNRRMLFILRNKSLDDRRNYGKQIRARGLNRKVKKEILEIIDSKIESPLLHKIGGVVR